MKLLQSTTILLVLTGLLFCCTSAKSEAISDAVDSNNPGIAGDLASDFDLGLQRHSLEIGGEYYNFTYQEPGGIEDEGTFSGGVINYTFRGWVPASPDEPLREGKDLFRVEFRYASGEADYTGSLSDGTPYNIDGIDYSAHETRLFYGIEEINPNWLASISFGFGYRFSTDDTSFDPYGYERESNYFYIPFAYKLDGKFDNDWAWGLNLEVDFLASGKQKSFLSDVGETDIENDQKSGY